MQFSFCCGIDQIPIFPPDKFKRYLPLVLNVPIISIYPK
jgi:Histidine kinase-, DNA gyrase B-, and HSP90-like ATPase